MELIPILSLIILVATISTFILAVGAYILYKIRERKGKETTAQPATIPAELISPAPMMAEQQASRTVGRRTFTRESAQEPIYAPTQTTGPQLRPTYVNQTPQESFTEASRYSRTGEMPTLEGERYSGQRKYTRYTTEGFDESKASESKKEKEEKESLKWR